MDDQMPPGGWPMRQAIFKLASTDRWRAVAAGALELEGRGHAIGTETRLLWLELRGRLRRGEVVAHGRLWGSSITEMIPGDFFEESEPDYKGNRVESGGVVYVNVHVAPAPAAQPKVARPKNRLRKVKPLTVPSDAAPAPVAPADMPTPAVAPPAPDENAASTTSAPEPTAEQEKPQDREEAAQVDPLSWMTAHMAQTPRPKRDVALKACCEATGVTWRTALEAWNKLPSELRRPRGRPR